MGPCPCILIESDFRFGASTKGHSRLRPLLNASLFLVKGHLRRDGKQIPTALNSGQLIAFLFRAEAVAEKTAHTIYSAKLSAEPQLAFQDVDAHIPPKTEFFSEGVLLDEFSSFEEVEVFFQELSPHIVRKGFPLHSPIHHSEQCFYLLLLAVVIFFELMLAEVDIKLFVQPDFWLSLAIEPYQLFAGLDVAEESVDAVKALQSGVQDSECFFEVQCGHF